MSTVDLLLAIAVSLSMLVGWWRGRRSFDLGGVSEVLSRDETTVDGRFRVGRARTTFTVRFRRGDAWLDLDFGLNDEAFAETVREWIEKRGRS